MQRSTSKVWGRCVSMLIGIGLLAGMFWASRHDFLLFHGMAEFFSIVVAAGVFAFAWHTAQFRTNDFFLFLGLGYLSVAFIDLLHTLTYKGVGTIESVSANAATQLWIAGRYLQAATILIAPVFLRRTMKLLPVAAAYAAATGLVVLSVFSWKVFPDCFVDGTGLTACKIISEYVVMAMLAGGLAFLWSRRGELHPRVLRYLTLSILCTIGSEVFFTYYVSVYGFSNVLGHFLKIYAYYFMYRAIIRTGLREPFSLLFHNLRQSEEALRKAHDELETKVQERTRELAEANCSLLEEVSARERVQEALNVEHSRLEGILNAMENGVYIVNQRHEIEYINPVIQRDFGRVQGRRCYEYFHDRDVPCPWCSIPRVVQGRTVRWEWYSHKTGRTYDLCDVPLRNADGTVSKLEIFFDVTERTQAQEALRESEARYRQMVETAGEGIWTLDTLGVVTFVNHRMADLLGYTADEMVGRKGLDFVADEDRSTAEMKLGERRRGAKDRYELRLRRKDGSSVWTLVSASSTLDREGEFAGILFMVADITAMKEAEKERALLSAAVRASAEGILITTDRGRIEYVNPAFRAMSGYDMGEIIGRTVAVLETETHDEKAQREMWGALRRGNTWAGRLTQRRKDGSSFESEMTISPISGPSGRASNYVALIRDITDQLRMEGHLRQAQKMEAIGTLAGGIAHDFNNILAAIIGFTEMCLQKVTEGPIHRRLEQVLKAGIRGRELAKQILAFSRKSGDQRRPVSLRLVLDETVDLLRASLPSTIEIRSEGPAGSEIVIADPNQIQQIVMNLCTNAAHAIGDEPGAITITLTDVSFDVPSDAPHPDLTPGIYARLSVSDTGPGIERALQERIFDPFFTTKKPGEGTGLGLSVVHGIARSHGGAVTVDSEPGKGTTFHVFLPRSSDPAADGSEPAAEVPRGSERILVIDDETSMVEITSEMLQSLGYEVTATTDAAQGVRIFSERPDLFDLVIVDQTMPRTTGIGLARELRAIRSDVRIILSTGRPDIDPQVASREGIEAMVSKPLTRAETARTVRAVLDAKS